MERSDKKLLANYERKEWLTGFSWRHDDDDLLEFSSWLSTFLKSERFLKVKHEFDRLSKQLEGEDVVQKRAQLLKKIYALK